MARGSVGRRVGGVVGALLVVSGVLACGPAGGPAAGGGAAGRTSPAVVPAGAGSEPADGGAASAGASTVQVAAPVGPPRQFEMPLVSTAATMVPLWVAAEQGLFRRHGLDPQLLPMPPATTAQALSAGSVSIAAAGGSVVSAWVGGATDLVFVAGISSKAPYRVVVKPDILRMDDLRGKSIGVSTPGSSPTVAMVEVLRRYGMEAERDVNLTYLRDSSATVAAFTTGVVQGVATSSPQVELAMAEGGRLLLDMRELNVPILGPQIATTRGLVEREPDFIRRVLMAYIEGVQLARDRLEEAIPSLMRGARLDDRDLAETAYREYYDVWDPWLYEAAIQTLLDNMDVPAARTTRPAEMQDDRFMRDLERSGWLAQHLRAR